MSDQHEGVFGDTAERERSGVFDAHVDHGPNPCRGIDVHELAGSGAAERLVAAHAFDEDFLDRAHVGVVISCEIRASMASTRCRRSAFTSAGTSSSIFRQAMVPGRGEYAATWTLSKRTSSRMAQVCSKSSSVSPG